MHPTLTPARLRRGAVIAATGALALGLLPLTGSSAAGVDQVSYVTSTALAANVGAPNGTATSPLTAAGYRTFSLDVSTDGNTALLAVCHGTYTGTATTSSGQCVDKPNGSSYDATFGLVMVHRGAGGTVRSKVLSTQWDANPVLTTSGGQTTAWFLLDGVLYSYVVSDTDVAGAPAVASASALASLKDAATGSLLESVTGLAVSSDGSRAAATFLRPGFVSGRVKEISLPDGATQFQQSFSPSRTANSVTTFQPSAAVLAFQGTTLLFGEAQFAAKGTPGNLKTFRPTDASKASEVTTLAGFYGLRQTSTGAWWAWKDSGASAGVSEVSDANLLTTAPAGSTPRADGSTTFGYVPSATAPPSLAEVAGTSPSVLAVPAGHASLSLSAKSVAFKGRAAIASQNFYWADLPGRTYNPKTANAAEVDKGTLLVSTDTKTWTKVATSGASAFGIGSTYYNGYTPALRANTFFQWSYAGDALTGPSLSTVRVVTVVPTVAVKVARSGRKTRVSGTITAWPGAMGLYVLRAGHWRTVASVTISKSAKTIGTYTFGYRSLAKGTYKVANRGTTGVGYASGARTFKI